MRIAARDPARAAAFYADCFGWVVTQREPAAVAFTTPGGLAGSFWGGGEPSSAGLELYVGVDDVHAVVARAVRLGACRVARPGPGPGGATVAQILDTEGNRVCVWQAPPSEKESAGGDGKADSRD